MSSFHDFLLERFESGGFTTEDALASFLPLAREVLDAHAASLVAPLEGPDALQVEGARIWFAQAKRLSPKLNRREIKRVESQNRSAVEVVVEARRTTRVDDGQATLDNLAIGRADDPIKKQVYLPGYQAWEHRLGHHDPLSDVFSLGMILASLICGLDFTDEKDLERFVEGRRNLFDLAPELHPVVARATVRMTELDRHRRAQDLGTVVRTLENYRDQDIDFDFDLARTKGFVGQDKRTKQHVVLTKLRERLFELSRRNRLLHFRPTMQSVNLTNSSVPLSFDIKNVRADQILTWTDKFQRELASGKPVSLNRYMNFSEVLYLPSVLDRLISESRRDQAEFGFAQLRLVACFLHWANVKEKPIEQFTSPLVLLPVVLKKEKGIRDTYLLTPSTTEAEINPVLRHQFKQLYDIELPESVDLASADLGEFLDYLHERIQTSQAEVTLERIDRPRVALLYDKARRRLDQYRRRARLAGRGVRSYLDLDYSYDAANYHPLGIKLFSAKIRPPETHLRNLIEENPRPRTFASAEPGPPSTERHRTFYSLQEGGDEDPYSWSVDLCSLTLANFRYRRMSLVRDYDALLDDEIQNPAFESAFSLTPREVKPQAGAAPPLKDRFDVLPCDPTQAAAIADAGCGDSYIIQGPPGTGKSQTIANLIADYVARGKRALFVCEKRAAIDVVYARLRQRGLGELCSLIHDSQTDKKAFVMDLKGAYETFLAQSDDASNAGLSRDTTIEQLTARRRPLEQFNRVMLSEPPHMGVSVRNCLERCITLGDECPDLDTLTKERLPDHASWWQSREKIQSFTTALNELAGEKILARHPMRILSTRITRVDSPLALVSEACEAAESHLRDVEKSLTASGVARVGWDIFERARALVDYALRLAPLAAMRKLSLLDAESQGTQEFARQIRQLEKRREVVEKARRKNEHWRTKPSATDTALALEQAVTFEQGMFAWLKPSWWKLRTFMNRAYDFRARVVTSSWSRVLNELTEEHQRLAELEAQESTMSESLGVAREEIGTLVRRVADLQSWIPQQQEWLEPIHAEILADREPEAIITRITGAARPLDDLQAELDKISDDWEHMSLDVVGSLLEEISEDLDDLGDSIHCLSELDALPGQVAHALRTLELRPAQIEAAVADHSLEVLYRSEREVARYSALVRNRHAGELETAYDRLLDLNAAEIRRRARKRFIDNVQTADLPAAKLSRKQKEFKKSYNRGRRELEHEFGKSMRYKAIRDLVAGDSGEVIKDLKPVWLMSPLSVSDTLPLDTDHVDVVIFDEASQITLEEAVPALFRASQAIIVGDEMQLPPTDFFSAKRSEEEDEELLIEAGGELVQYDLDSNSFLNHAARNLPATMLEWHYRSRSESLISFSNWAFYDGRLLTVPEEARAIAHSQSIEATCAADGETGATHALARPISFHFASHGVYEKRRNRGEAEYIAQMVKALLKDPACPTLGVVAFSEAQQDEIEQALIRLGQQDKQFQARFEEELEREEDGQFVGLLVKNLENIQGDERDVIVLSICYAHGPEGRMRMNFGPINKSGGEKRLNVAFSRAKRHMAVVSSIRYTDITNDYNDGANCLKNYLHYAEALSSGDPGASQRILQGLSRFYGDEGNGKQVTVDAVAEQISKALSSRGFRVDRSVGQSHFRCDLAVYREGDAEYRLGILIDNAAYYEQSDLLERDVMRPRLLRNFGWPIAHVLAKDWYDDAEAQIERLLRRIDGELDDDDVPSDVEDAPVDPDGEESSPSDSQS